MKGREGGYHEENVTKSTGGDANGKLPGQNLLRMDPEAMR